MSILLFSALVCFGLNPGIRIRHDSVLRDAGATQYSDVVPCGMEFKSPCRKPLGTPTVTLSLCEDECLLPPPAWEQVNYLLTRMPRPGLVIGKSWQGRGPPSVES